MEDKEREEPIEDTPPDPEDGEKPDTEDAREEPVSSDSVKTEGIEADKRIRVDNLSPRQLLELETCTRCSECVQWCPVYAQDEKDDLTPRTKAKAFRKIMRAQDGILSMLVPRDSWLARKLNLKGRQEKRIEQFIQGLYECSTCGQCHYVCPSYIDTVELWEGIRKSMVNAGYGPLENHEALTSSVKSYDNPWYQPRSVRDKWAKRAKKQKQIGKVPKNLAKERAEVFYFVGCTASFDVNIKEVAVNTVKLLNACDVDFGILGVKEKCCGSVLLRVGDPEYERLARENIEAFNNLGIKTLVTSCAGCYKTISQDYPKVGKMNFEILHMVQFIDRLIQEGKIHFKQEVPMRVTYHDPCHLGRASGIYEAPRRILKSVPGIEFVEIERHHENSRCCGAGGGLKAGFPEVQQKMSQARVRDAVATGATDFVTACPFCYQGLLVGITAEEAPIRMRDITEILTRALGVADDETEGREDGSKEQESGVEDQGTGTND
jgi:heterodisulfide reductase subunit D